MLAVLGAGQHLQVGKDVADQGDDLQGRLGVADGDHHGAGAIDVHGEEDVRLGCIAEVDLLAGAAGLGDAMRIQVDGDEGLALGREALGHGFADPAETGDNHMIAQGFGFLGDFIDRHGSAALHLI